MDYSVLHSMQKMIHFCPEANILWFSAVLGDLHFEMSLYYMDDEPVINDVLPFLEPKTFVEAVSLENVQINFYNIQTGKGKRMALVDSCPKTEVLGCVLWLDLEFQLSVVNL